MTGKVKNLAEIRTTRVLLVDDDPLFVARVRYALDSHADVCSTRDGHTALKLAASWQPHVILLDLLLDDVDGFTFVERLGRLSPTVEPFVLYACDGLGADTRLRAFPNWKVGTLVRTLDANALRDLVLEALRRVNPGPARTR